MSKSLPSPTCSPNKFFGKREHRAFAEASAQAGYAQAGETNPQINFLNIMPVTQKLWIPTFVSKFGFRASNLHFLMVPRAGLEPAQSHDHEILSLARMPVSPPRQYHGSLIDL
jgi:hypothetical protein